MHSLLNVIQGSTQLIRQVRCFLLKLTIAFSMIALAVIINSLVIGQAEAASVYCVRSGATGANNGSDWNNAFTDLPSAMTRGDIYYVADGTYSGRTFNTSTSGTTVITIKKAIISDHGTSTGWLDSYGDGQAEFGMLNFTTGYWLFDGVTGGGPKSWTSGLGFRITTTDHTKYNSFITLGANASNITVTHVDIGRDTQPNPGCDCAIYSPSGADNITLSYSYVHHFGDVGFTILNSSGWVMEYNRFDRIDRNGPKDGICGTLGQENHGSGIELYDTEGFVIRYNNISNIEGTGWIGYYGSAALNNVSIYGNVFYNTTDYTGTWGNGVIYNTSGAGNITNLKVYNNTFANLNSAMIIGITHDTSGNEFKNNIIYKGVTPGYSGCFKDYNASDNPVNGDANLQILTSNIFSNLTNNDFRLAQRTKGGDSTIGADFSKDAFGFVRGTSGVWNRGAYEYTGEYTKIPSPPLAVHFQ